MYGRSRTTTCWAFFFSPLHVWAVRTLSRDDGQLPLPWSYATISIHCWWCCILWPCDYVTARLSIFDRVHCNIVLLSYYGRLRATINIEQCLLRRYAIIKLVVLFIFRFQEIGIDEPDSISSPLTLFGIKQEYFLTCFFLLLFVLWLLLVRIIECYYCYCS